MRRAEALRDEAVQTLSQSLGGRAAEHPLGGRVEEHYALILIDGDDRVHRRGQDAGELGLAQSQRGGDLRLMLIVCDKRFLCFHNFSRGYRFSACSNKSMTHHSSAMPGASSTLTRKTMVPVMPLTILDSTGVICGKRL